MEKHLGILGPHFGFSYRFVCGVRIRLCQQPARTCEILVGTDVFEMWLSRIRFRTRSIAGGERACLRSGRLGFFWIGFILGDRSGDVLKQVDDKSITLDDPGQNVLSPVAKINVVFAVVWHRTIS